MRKLVFSTIGVFILSFIIFTACKKEETLTEPYTIDMNSDDFALEKQIKTFREDMNSTLKSNQVMHVDEAIWMIEAAFNYAYTFTNENYRDFITDVTVFNLEYNSDNMTSFSNIQELYESCDNFISSTFYSNNQDDIHVNTVMLEIIDDNCENGIMTIELTVEIGIIGELKKTSYFGSSDYWAFAEYAGKCNGYTGGTGSDAGNEIRLEAKSNLIPPGLYYYTDIVYDIVLPHNYPYNGSGYESLLYQSTGGFSSCLSPSEMNFYYDGLVYIINDKKPINKVLKNCDLEPTVWTGTSMVFHECSLWYGVRHVREDDPQNPF